MQIKLEHLTKRFGDTVAVNDLSITLESGKLIARSERLRQDHNAEYDLRHSPRERRQHFL